jgi:hypothetical protein
MGSVKKPLSPELLAHDALKSARLVEALTLLASEHAAQHRLSEAAVVGAFCWVVGGIVGASARDGRGDLEQLLAFLQQQVRRRAVGEMSRRAYTLH